MKLYSHAQLIKTTLLCVVAAVLVTAAICINIGKKKSAGAEVAGTGDVAGAEISEIAVSAEDAGVAESIESSVAFLEQNPASVM